MRAIKPLRAMNLNVFYLKILKDHSNKLKYAHYKQMISAQSLRIFHEPLLIIGAISGIYIAIHFGGLEGSALIVIMVFFLRIMTGLNQAQSEYQRLVKEQSALMSLTKNLNLAEEKAEASSGQKECPASINTLSFQKVSFYHEAHKVLNQLDVTFDSNQLTVIMGESGSGKTTILDLLTRFITPSKGKIIINNTIDLNQIDVNSWRKHIGLVPQDIFLFNSSLRDNILLERKDFTDKNIYNALKKAGAYDFVTSLKGQLDYQVGENGQHLSGGQKQRLSIARAILHNPTILILDEPTSALDFNTERNLFKTFKNLSKNMIVIVASHNKELRHYADQCINI
jgi:ATP-binding cassette subfamily C protein